MGCHVYDAHNFYHPNFVWAYIFHFKTKLNDFKASVCASNGVHFIHQTPNTKNIIEQELDD
jgi:hypothetical protein